MVSQNKMLRWVIVVVTTVMLLLSVKLWVSFVLNELFIEKYNRGEYDKGLMETVMIVNIPEGYVAHYNLGNAYYQTGDMEKARNEYVEALKSAPSERICDVRLNLGLAMVGMIEQTSDKLRDELMEVINVLLADGCAAENGNGRHDGAQSLYNEIMVILNSSNSGNGNSNNDENETPSSGDDSDVNEEELEEWLREEAEEAQYEHNNDYNSMIEEMNNYEYYDGKIW